MDREDLLSSVSQDIFGYLLDGSLAEDVIAEIARPEDLDTRFGEYSRLADLHFVLRVSVEEFISDLDYQLRSIRTTTRRQSSVARGGIDGHIDWPSTYQHRYSTEPGNDTVYVCNTREEQYDIPENIVLKALLETISTALSDVSDLLEDDRGWVRERWPGDKEAINAFQRLLERNVHISELRDTKPNEPTDRMLTTAANSRDEIYRDAAQLVEFRQELQRGSPEALRELLADTMVTPDDEDTLFELFVLFGVITEIEDMGLHESLSIQTIQNERASVGRFRGENDLHVFYNQSGRQQDISFLPVPKEQNTVAASRGDAVQIASREAADAFFPEKSFERHTKRPDVLVVTDADDWSDAPPYLVVEVKNSTRPSTIRDGINELLEYLAFMRREGEFVFTPEAKFGPGPNGVLVIQDIDPDETTVLPYDEQELPITILQAEEFRSGISGVIRQLLK